MGDITHISSEAINGYKEVKSFGGESYEKERFFNELEKQNSVEQYMLNVEKAFVPPGYRYYAEIIALKEMDTIKRKRWPELTELMDKSE